MDFLYREGDFRGLRNLFFFFSPDPQKATGNLARGTIARHHEQVAYVRSIFFSTQLPL